MAFSRAGAEFVVTFVLVFGTAGSAVIAAEAVGAFEVALGCR